MVEYLGKITEAKDIDPYVKQYKVFYVECPKCGYKCEVHAQDEISIWDIYPKCHICGKQLLRRDKTFKLKGK
jgi:ribosomal protein S27E